MMRKLNELTLKDLLGNNLDLFWNENKKKSSIVPEMGRQTLINCK